MYKDDDEDPTIELYMYSLNQEFPAGKGHQTYLKRYSELKADISGRLQLHEAVESQVFRTGREAPDLAQVPADWSVQWLSNQWIRNDMQVPSFEDILDPLKDAVVREEDFGGIIFEPRSDRVYRVNRSGLRLFNAIRENQRAGADVADLRIDDFASETIRSFIGAMRAAGLIGGK